MYAGIASRAHLATSRGTAGLARRSGFPASGSIAAGSRERGDVSRFFGAVAGSIDQKRDFFVPGDAPDEVETASDRLPVGRDREFFPAGRARQLRDHPSRCRERSKL